MSSDFLVIVLVPLALLIVVLGFVTLNRYIAYKERVALAERGFSARELARREARGRQGGRGVLWGGVITMMSGLALLLGLATLGTGYWLIAGLLPLFVGLGMLLIYFIVSSAPVHEIEDAPSDPEPSACDSDPWQERQPDSDD
jgi:hypothetical protein